MKNSADNKRVFICGSALRGQPDHQNLQSALFVRSATTAPQYRLHAAANGWHPAIYEVSAQDVTAGLRGIAIPGELYDLTAAQYDYLVSTEPPFMYPAEIRLENGETAIAILYPRVLIDEFHWPDISETYGGWAAYKAASVNDSTVLYPRDMVGYGATPPPVTFPHQAKIAVQFVINYEEGGENCILHGDPASEAFLSEIVGAQALPGVRHMNMESIYEYGSRSGFWRLYRLFTSRNIPVTVYGIAMALMRNPEAVAAMKQADWEIASHGYRWIEYQFMDEAIEREHLQKAIAIHTAVTGSRPLGWYTGRTSPNTRKLVMEEGGFLYDSDSYADDLPYWITSAQSKPHLVIPYTLDNNDMRFATNQGFNSGDQFFAYLRDAFDVLYAEGETTPKMMSIGLHCRLVGRPGRAAALARFLDYVQGYDRVWLCRRVDIAQHWHRYYPCAMEG
ncbi:MAG: allantoinase PuuE [Synechococcales bacterium]|nr:allantoinase PuuE [Synechococcales bacterium]